MKISGKFILKVAGTLTVISLVVAALLGLVNNVTADKIAEIDAENTRIAMSAVVAEGKDRRAAVKAANAASQERAHDFEDQLSGTAGTIADAAVANADTDTPAATAPADPAAAASPAVSPNAAAAQAEPAPVGNSPYTVQ